MPAPKQKYKSNAELLKAISSGFKSAAARPNVYGYRPHERQVEFHSSPHKGRLFLGGNRSGKTVAGAVEAIWWATRTHPYLDLSRWAEPLRGRVVSVDFLNGVEKIVRPEVARWCPTSALKGGSWETAYSKELRTLSFENGSFIEFMSYDQDLDKFAGTSRHFVWFDEEPPQAVFEENMMRLIDTGGQWWITMTPVEGMTWIYDDVYLKWEKKEVDHIHVVKVDMSQNPHLNQGEIDIFMSQLAEDEVKARKEGRFISSGGLIYKNFSDKNIVEPFKPPVEWMHVAAMDHGFRNPTAWLWAAINPEGHIYIYDEHYESDKIVSYHAQKVHEINAIHERAPDYYVGDPSIRNTDPITGTSILLEYMEYGVPIMLGNNDQRAGINRVTRYIGDDGIPPRLFITSNCVNLLSEIRRLRWQVWADKKSRRDKNFKEEQHKKYDHACDAMRYLISSRPEMDKGTEIPERGNFLGASVGVDPYNRVDESLLKVRTRHADYSSFNDPVMGGEF